MGLNPESEAFHTQIFNIVPLPSLFETFVTVDGNERQHRIIFVPNQIAFAAPSCSPSIGSQFFY